MKSLKVIVIGAGIGGITAATQLTKGNLSVHLGKLENAGLIEIQKTFQGKIPRTLCMLTMKGKESFQIYKNQMKGVLGE